MFWQKPASPHLPFTTSTATPSLPKRWIKASECDAQPCCSGGFIAATITGVLRWLESNLVPDHSEEGLVIPWGGCHLLRRLFIRLMLTGTALIASALLIEYVLEARDVAKYASGETFASVGDARIRYKLLGADHAGATVVILSGMRGSIEQSDQLQSALSREIPALSYDRGGYGFSQDSTAHSAWDQATELAELLRALKIKGPVVLVPFSGSADLARVFAGRYPEITAGMYMIEPTMPEVYKMVPPWHGPRRTFVRVTFRDLLASSIGSIRLKQRLASWQGPESLVEQRANAILASRSHYWALAKEWYELPESNQQALDAPVSGTLPILIAASKHATEDESTKASAKLYSEFIARSSRGRLIELQAVDHSNLVKEGPALDRIVAGIVQLSKEHTP